ncbi:hypothetical protein BX616_011372, partial [Lobosporangium transversale]
MADVDEFPQNDEAAKRFKSGPKRKQPGTVILPPASSSSGSSSFSYSLSTQQPILTHNTPASSAIETLSSTSWGASTTDHPNISGTSSMVYQQPRSIQHHTLPAQPLQLDSSSFQHLSNGNSIGSAASHDSKKTTVSDGLRSPVNESSSTRHVRNSSSFLDLPTPKTVNIVDHSSAEDLEALTTMLAETTLNSLSYYGPNAAMVATVFNDEDLWGPQLGAGNTESDVLVPEELQILPDAATRDHLIALYYKNHYCSLPMVQREVLRVCQENIHIPHCLLLCNAVYYCGSMYSANAHMLRKDMNDESTVGEEFFSRGQALLEKKYLTTHLCTIQALLLFAIGFKSPAQRLAFISQAITMALDMGLHTRLDESIHPFVRAYRARVFWCCYLFDSTASAVNGKPGLINDDEISVEMFQAGDLGPESETFSDQYLIHCLHGWQLCRKIRKNSKLIVRQPPPDRSLLLDNLARLDNELVEWQRNLPKPFDFQPIDGCIISKISSLAACAQLLCYALIILLHHPYLPNPKSPDAFQPPAPGMPDSQGYCTQAAKEITKIAGILLREAPRTFEQNTPARYALNFAIRIHLRNSKCIADTALAKDSRRDLQKTMDYIEHVENLQFFRINRGKKSDVADLLASCRAALAQQKSSLDLAKEAAAIKHRQMLKEKEALKMNQTRQQAQKHDASVQPPVLASQPFPTFEPVFDTSPSPSQIVRSMQEAQQHKNIQQQSYKQHELHVQMYTQERNQQELAKLNQLQRQGQLDLDHQRQEYFQQLAMAKHKQQIFMQHQHHFHHPHVYRPQPHQPHLQQRTPEQQTPHLPITHSHRQQQNLPRNIIQAAMSQASALDSNQIGLTPFVGVGSGVHNVDNNLNHASSNSNNNINNNGNNNDNSNNNGNGNINGDISSNGLNNNIIHNNNISTQNYGSNMLPLLNVQDPSVFAKLSPEQQQQLFVAFSQSLINQGNILFPQQGPVDFDGKSGQGAYSSQRTSMLEFGGLMSNIYPSSLPLSDVSHIDANTFTSVALMNNTATISSNNSRIGLDGCVNDGVSITPQSMQNQSQSLSQLQAQVQQQQQQNSTYNKSAVGVGEGHSHSYNHNNSNIINNTISLSDTNGGSRSNRFGSPESISSPGGSISEESILKSWSISTLHDNIFLDPNIARDDPRNDLGSFMYLPSEFEYGDAAALSPSLSSTSGS